MNTKFEKFISTIILIDKFFILLMDKKRKFVLLDISMMIIFDL